MPTYIVTFTNIRRYVETVVADSEDEATTQAVTAYNRGELEPDESTLDHFEAEEAAP